MPELNCSVLECGHNVEGLCNLQHVDVARGGRMADTCCASFTAMKDLSFLGAVNSVNPEKAQYTTGVQCSAEKCHYNFGNCCSADRIKIVGGSGAGECGDTKCGTYKPR